MEGKLLGLGLKNIFGLFLLFALMTLIIKVVMVKKPVPGVTEIAQLI
jgi:hypothetical protein